LSCKAEIRGRARKSTLSFLNMMKDEVVREREEEDVRSDWWDDDTRVEN